MTAETPPADSSIEVTFRMTRGDLTNATIQLQRRSAFGSAVGAWATTLSLLTILLTGDWTSLWFLAFGLALLTGVYCLPFIWLSIRRRPDLLLSEQRVRVTDDGVEMSTPLTSGQIAWDAFRRVREVPGTFLLDFGTGASALIPTRMLDEVSRRAIRDLAAAKGKLDRSSGWEAAIKGFVVGAAAAVVFFVALTQLAR